MKSILEQAKEINDYIITLRREFHQIPEIGFDLPQSKAVIVRELVALGYEPKEISKAGIVAEIGSGDQVLLLRADYDGLPMSELTDLEFKSTNGNMHACGHDTHASMLLGTAKLLKQNENKLPGRVRLMFQPAEELGLGAIEMINAGVLEDVNKAYMIHAVSGAGAPNGKLIFPGTGSVLSSSYQFKITIQGVGSHGAMPNLGVDAVIVAAHTTINIQTIISREKDPFEPMVISIGAIDAGHAYNIIADSAVLKGTFRAFTRSDNEFISKRITEIAEDTAKMFKAKCSVEIIELMTPLIQDEQLAAETMTTLNSVFAPEDFKPLVELFGNDRIMGSEDFAFISEKVPSNMFYVGMGMGQSFSLHNPNLVFADDHLYMGSAAFLALALNQK